MRDDDGNRTVNFGFTAVVLLLCLLVHACDLNSSLDSIERDIGRIANAAEASK